MGAIEKFLTGLTVVAVVATAASSPYTSGIFSSIFTGIANTYKAAKH